MKKTINKMCASGRASLITGAIFTIFLGVLLILFLILMGNIYLRGESWSSAENLGDYCYLDVAGMTDSFASDENGSQCVIVWEEPEEDDGYVMEYVVMLSNKDYEKYNETIIPYTYGETSQNPGSIIISGYAEELSGELKSISIEAFANYLDYPELTEEEFDSYYAGANAYLDASQGWKFQFNGYLVTLIFLLILLIWSIIALVGYFKEMTAMNRITHNTLSIMRQMGIYEEALDSSIASRGTFVKGAKCWLVDDKIISYQRGLDVIPISEITQIYGFDKTKNSFWMTILFGFMAGYRVKHSLIIITKDTVAHEIAILGANLGLHNQIVQYITAQNPSVLLGRNDVLCTPELNMNLNLSKITSFYGSSAVWSGRTQELAKMNMQ